METRLGTGNDAGRRWRSKTPRQGAVASDGGKEGLLP